MTDLTIAEFGDAWINGVSGKTGINYGSTATVQVKSGERRGLLKPALPNFAGATVVAATLVGRIAEDTGAQTFTLSPLTERLYPGRVTWGSTGGPAADTASAVTAVVASRAAGSQVSWDVTAHMQAVADGTDWYGWRLTTNAGTTTKFVAVDSGAQAWELFLTTSDVPDQPTDLRPSDGAVEDSSPIVSWLFSDGGFGSTAQAQSRVQVDTPTGGADPDELTPDYDSGWQANVAPEWDLTGRRTVVGAGPHYWRVQVKDGDNNTSDWSDWALFTVAAMPALVVDSPTGPFGDPTPTLLAHLTSGSIAHWYAYVTGPARQHVRASSGQQTGGVDWTVPLRKPSGRRVLLDDVGGWLYLRVYPVGSWVAAVGAAPYREAWVPLDFDDDLGVVAPTSLTVAQVTDGEPFQTWTWKRTSAADAYLAMVDGVTVARIDAADVVVDAGSYTWTDNGEAAPMLGHDYSIRAIEGNLRSVPVTVTERAHSVDGVWVIPDAAGIAPFCLAGTDIGSLTRVDKRATYTTLAGEEVDITYGLPGRTGTFSGVVDSRDGDDVLWGVVREVEKLRDSPIRSGRLVYGSQSLAGRFRDVDVMPSGDMLPSNLEHIVSFGFVGEPD